MNLRELKIPDRLNSGDTVAFISISGGRGGDADLLQRYNTGKARFEECFGVNVIETPNALKGSEYLYGHPEKRAEDLMWALTNKDIKGIVCIMGGDDSYRVLPFIDTDVIRDNPKVFMGYSDIATWNAVFAYAGVRAFYGPNVLNPIAQPGSLDPYTEEAIRKALFSSDVIGEIKPCEKYTSTNWTATSGEEITWTANDGYKVIQGTGTVKGRIISICGGPLQQIMGTRFFPCPEMWEDSIIAYEYGSPINTYGSELAALHQLRAFAAAGIFEKAKAIITGPVADGEYKDTLLKVINKEAGRPDMVILENVDFIHRVPMTVLPTGALAEIDCGKKTFTICESGVK